MTNAKKKIEELNQVLSEHSDMRGSRQVFYLFPQFYQEKLYKLEVLLSEKYGIAGKSKIIALAVSYLIEEIEKDEKV